MNALDGDTESDDEIEPEVQRMDDYKHKTMTTRTKTMMKESTGW